MGSENLSVKVIDKGYAKNAEQYITSRTLSNGLVAEAIAIEDFETTRLKPMLLIGDGNGYWINEVWIDKGQTLKAVDPRKYPYKPYLFDPRITYKRPSTQEVFEDVLAEFKRFLDLEEIYQVLLTAATMLSYVQERFETTPYIYLLGDNESGKSHAITLLNALAYRPLYGASIPEADLYTYLGDGEFTPTILEDEIQGIERDVDKAKIWKVGYKRGAKIPRIKIKSNGEREIEYFEPFCLKFAAGEKLIKVKGLRERFIIISMVEGDPEKDYYEGDDYERFAEIRNKLLLWRLDKLTDPSFGKLDLPWLRKRMRELHQPLLAVLKETRHYPLFENFVKKMIDERIKAKRDSFEGFLTRIVARVIAKKKSLKVEFLDIWAEIKAELDVEESLSNPNKLETDVFGNITKHRVGQRLHEVLGAEARREWDGGKTKLYRIFKATKLLKAIKKYHVFDGENLKTLTDLTTLTDFLRGIVEKEIPEKASGSPEKPTLEPPYTLGER